MARKMNTAAGERSSKRSGLVPDTHLGLAPGGSLLGGGEMEGVKHDQGKPRMSLVPPRALREVAEVLTLGAAKYEPENWRKVLDGPDGPSRYLDAALRHINAYQIGFREDEESGRNHLAHAVCCLLFLVEGDQ